MRLRWDTEENGGGGVQRWREHPDERERKKEKGKEGEEEEEE